jgi:hypothetical protein
MAKASSGALSTVILDPSDEQYVKSFREAQASLQEALDTRNNQLFDPMLLAISQALGAPTKTGSFGEVLGNVAGAIGTSQQAEEKRAQDIARMRFDMAQQNFMLNRKDQAAKMLAPPQAGAPAGAPAAGAPAGALTGGSPAATAAGGAETSAVPKPAGLSQFGHITPELALQIGLRDPELGKQAMQYIEAVNAQRKLAQEAVRFTEKGSFVVDPTKPGGGTFTPAPGGAYETRFVPGVGNTPMTREDAVKFDLAKDVLSKTPDDVDAQKELTRIISKTRGPQKGAATGPMTPSQAELEKKRAELDVESEAKSDSARKEDFITKAQAAMTRLPSLSSLEQFAVSPESSKLLGVFEGSSLGQAIAKMVDPTLPQLREAFTQYGLPEGIKANQAFTLQQTALVNSEIRKITRAPGEGAQSDLENRMALAAGLDKTDTPGGFLKKVRFLKAQAEFQRDVGRELNKSKMPANDFLFSDKYQNLLQTYEQRLGRILDLSPQQARPSQGAAGNYGPAKQKLLDDIGGKK